LASLDENLVPKTIFAAVYPKLGALADGVGAPVMRPKSGYGPKRREGS
jgi:hypothetical protein